MRKEMEGKSISGEDWPLALIWKYRLKWASENGV